MNLRHPVALFILRITFCIGSAVGLVLVLYFANTKRLRESFTRLFPPHVVLNNWQLDLGVNSFYIAGLSNTHIYLANTTAPALIIESNYELSDTTHIKMTFPDTVRSLLSGFKTTIDSPNIYIAEGITGKNFNSVLSDYKLIASKQTENSYDASIPLSVNSHIIRSYDSALKQTILLKLINGHSAADAIPYPLDKQLEGIFSTDGEMSYSASSGRLWYTYYYQNQFTCLDTNLNILYKGRTIDSNRTAKIKLATIPYENGLHTTFSAPPRLVNRTSCADDNYIYVNSNILSANTSTISAAGNSIIDVYYLSSGRYKFSFFVPNYAGKRFNSFRVKNKRLVAIFGETLFTYKLNF